MSSLTKYRAREIRQGILDARHPLIQIVPEPRWPYLYGIAFQRAKYPRIK